VLPLLSAEAGYDPADHGGVRHEAKRSRIVAVIHAPIMNGQAEKSTPEARALSEGESSGGSIRGLQGHTH
jgi:hypothetical protein